MSILRYLRRFGGGVRQEPSSTPAALTRKLLDRPWEIEFKEECSEQDIYYCFRLILGRNPGQVEWPGHRSMAGRRLSDIVSMYVSAREFKNRNLGVLDHTEHALVDL